MQTYNSVMCGYFYITLLKSKRLVEYASLYSLKEYEKNQKIMLKYFRKIKMIDNNIFCC